MNAETIMDRQDTRQMQEFTDLVVGADIPDTLGEFVRQCAQRYGSQCVGHWFDDGIELSYAQLDEHADRLASSLLALGVRKGTHVAVMLGNTVAYFVSWVAISRLGAVMVPVNTAYQRDDLRFVLSDSDAQFFLVAEQFLPRYEQVRDDLTLLSPGRVIVYGAKQNDYLDWQNLVSGGSPDFTPPSRVSRTDLLNIQYTSGTTGFPKGCMLTHDYWLIITEFAAAPLQVEGGIRNVLVWQPFFYMDGMWLFLTAMRLGGTAYVARQMQLKSFYDWLEKYRIHYCIFPEAALKAKAPCAQDKQLELRYASIYGWGRESRQEVAERFGVLARESYGMTEIGLALLVPTVARDKARELTCGMPGPFRHVRVVDSDGVDVAAGQTGELLVSGRSILSGYYKRPDANAASFYGEWFRTGDVFYGDEDGYYYIVGRSKDMIRRAGENIAAREVEATLCSLDGVAEAAVVGVPDPLRREEVKAYILLRDGYTPESCPPTRIIEHCESRLARFKVPRYITYVSEFPRTPSRKIRKTELLLHPEISLLPVYDREQKDAVDEG